MDPISAAGIGLSVTSLALQVFSGCIKAYQLFVEAEDFPAAYGFLRVRLRFEQTRLLRWGEKIGLAEELLDSPSRVLQINRNLILDILLEIQALFKKTIKIQSKFDALAPEKALLDSSHNVPPSSFLKRTLNNLNKLPQAPKRLHWSLIKHEELRGLVEKLIGLNDAIEGMLEIRAIEELLDIQRQTYLKVLQLSNKIDDLKEIQSSMQIQGENATHKLSLVPHWAEVDVLHRTENQQLATLASFKSQEALSNEIGHSIAQLNVSQFSFVDDDSVRCEALHKSKHVWIEWKEYDADNQQPDWSKIILQRVQSLVVLLSSPAKSPQFRVPQCIGYLSVEGDVPNVTKYGLVYEKPKEVAPQTPYTTLLSELESSRKPSLTQRIALAQQIASSLMYLHSVNWLHKSFRSNNILFFHPDTNADARQSYTSPIVSGFKYSRIDLVDESTELVPEHSENDIYRHPQTLASVHLRSKKSYDIYSLGLVLIEIAFWQPIKDIIQLSDDERQAKRAIRGLRQTLLQREFMMNVEGSVGDSYAQAVVACLEGLVSADVDEEDPEVGVLIQNAFSERVVARLNSIKI